MSAGEWLTVEEYAAHCQQRGESSAQHGRGWLHGKRVGGYRTGAFIAGKEGSKYRGVWLISCDALDFEPPAVGRPAHKGLEGECNE